MLLAKNLSKPINRITKEIVEYAHARNVTVEAELGSVEIKDKNESNFYTDPYQAVDFIKKTGIDSLAV